MGEFKWGYSKWERGLIMEIFCNQCQAEFKDEDQVVLDILNKLTHEACYNANPGFVVTVGEFKEIVEGYANLVD
jgi:tRNA(Ile2) C34 agmatinyltransferase TiaS